MAVSILIATAVSIAASILLTRVLGKRMKFFKKLILTDSTKIKQNNLLDGVEGEKDIIVANILAEVILRFTDILISVW